MNLIAAVDSNWGIGREGKLLISIPNDMKYFRSRTLNKVVIMGRVTLESFPNGAPLKNRVNIVLSGNEAYKKDGAIVVHSVREALQTVKDYDTDDVYVIGGEKIYNEFEKYCDRAYITKIDYAFDADSFFPNLDAIDGWKVKEESDEMTYFDNTYRFVTYEREV
ncbi:MAG: dihydrofolate reductase [Lachnospiraceae bacterium]|jgi:dihydrofolate reductase